MLKASQPLHISVRHRLKVRLHVGERGVPLLWMHLGFLAAARSISLCLSFLYCITSGAFMKIAWPLEFD